jgi:hypothetical protein
MLYGLVKNASIEPMTQRALQGAKAGKAFGNNCTQAHLPLEIPDGAGMPLLSLSHREKPDPDHPANPLAMNLANPLNMNPVHTMNLFGRNPPQSYPFSHSAASMLSSSPGFIDLNQGDRRGIWLE